MKAIAHWRGWFHSNGDAWSTWTFVLPTRYPCYAIR